MNNLLMLSKEFQYRAASAPSHPTIHRARLVRSAKVRELAGSLSEVLKQWPDDAPINNILVNVFYNCVVAKSNRIKRILSEGSRDPEQSMCGARYDYQGKEKRHVTTHYVSIDIISRSIIELTTAAKILDEFFDGKIGKTALDSLWDTNAGNTNDSWKKKVSGRISRMNFAKLIHDVYYLDTFALPTPPEKDSDQILTTLFQTEEPAYTLLHKLGISVVRSSTLNNSAVLSNAQYRELCKKAPYLVAMSTTDLSKFDEVDVQNETFSPELVTICTPADEPTIGVIDTPFEEKHPVYFNDWVDAHKELSPDIPLSPEDYTHGTCVTSLIVDGPTMNPWLNDKCGHFKVRHFGVTPRSGMSSFEIARKIERIVSENPDILVWNLSLGSDLETELFSISPEAEVLDRLQQERDILFVVAGTNNRTEDSRRIGAPADSLNSLVVNAVRGDGDPASYSRHGPVLDFYRKPDVAYYGGDSKEPLTACCGTGAHPCMGTSYAAPLISRKAAFLMYKMGLSRDITKALLIDAACGWKNMPKGSTLGYGVVPISIYDVLQVPNNEIRFCVNGSAKAYETYDYRLPVPMIHNSFPYLARAVLTYTPKCDRNQGVDYTATELDLHLGRLRGTTIKSIKKNTQGEPHDRTREQDARDFLGKWDNVKRICEKTTEHPRARKAYDNPLWGIKIRKTSRKSTGDQSAQPFGLVVTLKEINNANRIDSFIQHCFAEGWIVRTLDVNTYVTIYNASQVEVTFD